MKNYFRIVVSILLVTAMITSVVGCSKKVTTSGDSDDGKDSNKAKVEGTATPAPSEEATKEPTKETEKEESPAVDLNGKVIKTGINGWTKDNLTDSASGQIILEKVNALEEKYNCTIELYEPNWQDYEECMASGTYYTDIWGWVAPHLFASQLKNNFIIPLSDLGIDFENESWIDKDNTANFKYHGDYYAIQPNIDGAGQVGSQIVMFFNKRILEARGIDPNSVYDLWKNNEWTWDKFEELCRKVSEVDANKDGKPDTYGAADIGGDSPLWVCLAASNGADVVVNGENGPKMNLSDPKAIEAFDYYQKLVMDNLVVVNTAETPVDFMQGEVAFMATYANRLWTFKDMEDDFGVIPVPMSPSSDKYVSIVPWFNGIGISSVAVKDDDENKTYTKVLVDIVRTIFTSNLTEEEKEEVFLSDIEADVRDEQTVEVWKKLGEYAQGSAVYKAMGQAIIPLTNEVVFKELATGKIDGKTMADTYEDKYNQIIQDEWIFD